MAERERQGPLGGEGEWGVVEEKLDGASERPRRKQVCFGSFSGAVGGEARPWPRSRSREKINAKKASKAEKERERASGKNISYVFGGEVVLDLTFPLTQKQRRREREIE